MVLIFFFLKHFRISQVLIFAVSTKLNISQVHIFVSLSKNREKRIVN